MAKKLMGYRRPNGKFGLRNYVLVISMVQCSNRVAEAIAYKTDTISITHENGCVEPENSHRNLVLGLTRAGQHPNVHSVLLVGLGCEQTDHNRIKAEIEKTGKRCEYVEIQQEGGSPEAIAKGVQIVSAFKQEAEAQPREELPPSAIVMAVQCGGSDWTTALAGNTTIGRVSDLVVKNGGAVRMGEMGGLTGSDHIVAEHAASYEVGKEVLEFIKARRDRFERETGQKYEDVNPTPGNKAGGISSLIEKSMGNSKKAGSTPVQGILQPGEDTDRPGVWLVNLIGKSGTDAFNLTSMAMSGANIALFCSGRGSPVGSAVMPVVKLTGNPHRFGPLRSIFDFNAGVVLEGVPLDEAGAQLYDELIDFASGRPTKSEINGDFEYCIP